MADKMTPEQRHEVMSHIRSKDTGPELLVRKALHAAGLRFRLHVRNLPGTPDIVLRKYRTAIFVNGCFWHGHRGCRCATKPKTNAVFWRDKISRNHLRDEVSVQYLEVLGWKVVTVWECELKPSVRDATISALIDRIRQNGINYALEQSERRRRNAEHRAMLHAARQRYAAVMEELQSIIAE